MTVRRRRRPGSDRLYVTSDRGLPLGHFDLVHRTEHDVPVAWARVFHDQVDDWLFSNGQPLLGTGPAPETPLLEAGVPAPEGGWEPEVRDLARHRPGHGLHDEALRARTSGGRGADRPHRLRADGQQAVAAALAKLAGTGSTLRRVRGPRWRVLHSIPMLFEEETVLLDHVVLGPSGVFAVEVQNHPGGRVRVTGDTLEIDGQKIDLGRRRRIGEEVEERLSESLAIAAGAETTLNPPPVTPVIAVVGAVVSGGERPRGVLVSRAGQLPRLMQAFGSRLSDAAVEQTFAVARRDVTWTR